MNLGRFSVGRIPDSESQKGPLLNFHLCELRHIALPRIDLPCRRFLPDWDPSPMAGSFLRSAVHRLALDSPGLVAGIARPIPFIKAI
jgi:hypothetical protein